jgi:serine/threonine-protein kinase CHEK2
MLVVDPEKRFTIDQCVSHPWLAQTTPGVNDSTGGLVGGIAGLEVNRRAPARERTLLSTLNSVEVEAQIALDKHKNPVKVFSKNKSRITNATKEAGPAQNRAPGEFMEMGGKGDQQLFGHDDTSIYPGNDTAAEPKKKQKQKAKVKGR